MSTPQEMSTTDQAVVIDQPDTEVVLTAFGFYARCKSCPWCSELTPSKSKARETGLMGHGCLTAKRRDADRELLRRNLASDQQDWLPLPAPPESGTVRVTVTWSETVTLDGTRELDTEPMRRLGYDPASPASIQKYLDDAYEFTGDDFMEWHADFSCVSKRIDADSATIETVEILP